MKSLGIGTYWTFFGNKDRTKLNRPKPKAVPDNIKSSIGPSWGGSDGNVGTDKVAVPSYREKKLLSVDEDTVGETVVESLVEIVEREKEVENPVVSGNP